MSNMVFSWFATLATLTTLIALATSMPTAASTLPGLATVDIRIVGPQNTHYTTSNQSPTSDTTQHLSVIVGQTLSLDHDPLHIQGLEMVAVKAGESLSLLPGSVDENDWRVTCSARIAGRQELVDFGLMDKGVLLAGGRLVKVSRISCGIDEVAR
ncbi:hypothetical protein SVAN01_09685 [Stagonosporopsis vannaccii]|nr:hypothetical protein SVAN01_09685 [Stagonosporopsis vannaccii]